MVKIPGEKHKKSFVLKAKFLKNVCRYGLISSANYGHHYISHMVSLYIAKYNLLARMLRFIHIVHYSLFFYKLPFLGFLSYPHMYLNPQLSFLNFFSSLLAESVWIARKEGKVREKEEKDQ